MDRNDIINVAVVNFRAVWGNKESNLARIIGYTESAAKRGADVICLPEMALTGYENEPGVAKPEKMQTKLAETLSGPSVAAIAEITKKYGVYTVFGMPERDPHDPTVIYNSATVCGPDGCMGSYRKLHPALEEQCWCTRGNEPFAFDTKWGKIGVGICYDTYNFHEVMRFYAALGARIYLNPTALAEGPHFDWKTYYVEGLKQGVNENEIYIASSNLIGDGIVDEEIGGSNGNMSDLKGCFSAGGSMILGPGLSEKVHTYAGDADCCDPGVFIATLDLTLAARRIFKVDPITGRPDYRPDLYVRMNEMLLQDPYWKQFCKN